MSKVKIDSLKVDLTNLRNAVAKKELLEKLKNDFQLKYAFEGVNFDGTNKVSEKDSQKIIKGEKVSKYSKREVREVINHYGAFVRMQEKAENREKLTEDIIKDLHEILTVDIIQGGIYRNVNIQIQGSPKQPIRYDKIYEKMSSYFMELEEPFKDPFYKAAYAHLELHRIHPFLDANGRLSRLVMNYILIENGYLPISITKKNLKKYFNALNEYKLSHNVVPFYELVIDLVEKRYKDEIKKTK